MTAVEDLLSKDDEGWTDFRTWAEASPRSVEYLQVDAHRRGECLLSLGVTTRSVMGALAWHTGGVLLHHRWLRLLGGVSADHLPDIASASPDASAYLVVALDVLGGRFAVSGGGLPGEPGEVSYIGPDTLRWVPLGQGYSDFVYWALSGDLEGFYADLMWTGWKDDAAATQPASLLACYPPLFAAEARHGGASSRKPAPWQEVLGFHDDMARQLEDVPDGGQVAVAVERKRRWRR